MEVVSSKIAMKTLKVFRKEQKKRTGGFYTGCYCAGCVECMQVAIGTALAEIKKEK